MSNTNFTNLREEIGFNGGMNFLNRYLIKPTAHVIDIDVTIFLDHPSMNASAIVLCAKI